MLDARRDEPLRHGLFRMLHPAVQALLLGILATTLVLFRRPRLACLAATIAIVWIWLASTPWLAVRLHDTLAARGTAIVDSPAADAIVVLGGGKLPVTDWFAPDTRAGMGAALWRRHVAPLLVVSGSDQATRMSTAMQHAGVPAAALVVESLSTTTHENAAYAGALLRQGKRWRIVLVTSAIHMPRAAGAFRREGLVVMPAPVDDGLALLVTSAPWAPRREALAMTARCLRERLALWVYRYRGWA